ncbi:MAG: hypothetical protein ABI366_08115, partial [Ginsengibacter sp.]
MFTKNQPHSSLKYSIAAAIVYLVCVVIFLSDDSYTQSYILYIGNMIFALVVAAHIVSFSINNDNQPGTYESIVTGFTTAIVGTVISCLAIFIILAIMKPIGYREVLNTASELAKPAPGLDGNSHVLMYMLFLDAIIGNLG